LLIEKFKTNLARRFSTTQSQRILDVCANQEQLEAMPVNEFVDFFVVNDGRGM